MKRYSIFEYPGTIQWSSAGIRGNELWVLEGPRIRCTSAGTAGRVLRRGDPRTTAAMVSDGDRIWLSDRSKVTRMLDARDGNSVAGELKGWRGLYGVTVADSPTFVGVSTRPELGRVETVEVADLVSGARVPLVSGRLPRADVHGDRVIAWTRDGQVAFSHRDGAQLCSVSLDAQIIGVTLVPWGDTVRLVVSLSPNRLLCLSIEDGKQTWSLEVSPGVEFCGSGPALVWFVSESGELFARSIGTGEVVHRYVALVASVRDGWVCSTPQSVLEANAEAVIARRLEDGEVIRRFDFPEHLASAPNYGAQPVGDHFAVWLSHRKLEYRGSVCALAWLNTEELERGDMDLEPRPVHRVVPLENAAGLRGYRVAMRARDMEQLLRMGQVLVQEVAYHKGESPHHLGDKQFDGTIEFAFDSIGLPQDAASEIDRAVEEWTEELAGMISAHRGGPIRVTHVPFEASMLDLC